MQHERKYAIGPRSEYKSDTSSQMPNYLPLDQVMETKPEESE